jgi:hypothetical protein
MKKKVYESITYVFYNTIYFDKFLTRSKRSYVSLLREARDKAGTSSNKA